MLQVVQTVRTAFIRPILTLLLDFSTYVPTFETSNGYLIPILTHCIKSLRICKTPRFARVEKTIRGGSIALATANRANSTVSNLVRAKVVLDYANLERLLWDPRNHRDR